jgi:hypothetical protein
MQSPFDSAKNTCVLYLEPILNSYYKTYQNILTVSNVPEGPLSSLVQTVSAPKLSPFQTMSAFSPPPISRTAYSQTCLLALSRYPTSAVNTGMMKCADNFMYAGDIPNVIGYLESNGYKIMADITHMAYKGPVDFASPLPGTFNRRQLIFMFRYEGK